MAADINYAEWYRQASDRKKDLGSELREVEQLLEFLRPLAERQGLAPTTPAPVPSQVSNFSGVTGVDATFSETPPAQEQGSNGSGQPADLPYRGVPSTDAAYDYLLKDGGERSTPEIADALKAGGLESTSENYKVNIYTSLKRLRQRGMVERVGAGRWRAIRKDSNVQNTLM
jgi:hypothetical protein